MNALWLTVLIAGSTASDPGAGRSPVSKPPLVIPRPFLSIGALASASGAVLVEHDTSSAAVECWVHDEGAVVVAAAMCLQCAWW